MISRWYPNLELAQAKSSLKYRVATPKDSFADRPPSPQSVSPSSSGSLSSSLSKRQHYVPTLHDAVPKRATKNSQSQAPPRSTASSKRRRRGDGLPTPSPLKKDAPSTSSLTLISPDVSRESRTTSGTMNRYHQPTTAASDDDTNAASIISESLSKKLNAINHIIARAEEQPPPTSPNAEGDTSVESRWKTVYSEHGEMLFDSTEPSPVHTRRGFKLLEPLGGATSTCSQDPRVQVGGRRSPHTNRKIAYLMKQPSPDRPMTVGIAKECTSPSRRRQVASGLPSSKYMITSGPLRSPDPDALPGPIQPQQSRRELNGARVMEFVDGVNMKPRRRSMVGLDKQLRRISLVSFEHSSSETKLLQRTESALALRRKQMFGIYSIREVMAVIRLFWFLDADRSGDITLDELYLHRAFFVKLGRDDLGAVFHELDVDGSGTVSLRELLRVSFRAANDQQLQAMLTLAKVGNLHEYMTGRHKINADDPTPLTSGTLDETRVEFQEIFHIFDMNGDGRINRRELLEALQVDEEMFAPALETSRAQWGENAKRIERAKAGGLTKDDIERFYSEYDKNRDEVLDFDEFLGLMEAAAGVGVGDH